MYQLKHKSQKNEKELTPEERIQWLIDFIEVQAKINPIPKQSKGYQLKWKNPGDILHTQPVSKK